MKYCHCHCLQYTASWADLTQLDTMNTTDQLAYLSLWLEAVSAGRVRVDGLQPRPSAGELLRVLKQFDDLYKGSINIDTREKDVFHL